MSLWGETPDVGIMFHCGDAYATVVSGAPRALLRLPAAALPACLPCDAAELQSSPPRKPRRSLRWPCWPAAPPRAAVLHPSPTRLLLLLLLFPPSPTPLSPLPHLLSIPCSQSTPPRSRWTSPLSWRPRARRSSCAGASRCRSAPSAWRCAKSERRVGGGEWGQRAGRLIVRRRTVVGLSLACFRWPWHSSPHRRCRPRPRISPDPVSSSVLLPPQDAHPQEDPHEPGRPAEGAVSGPAGARLQGASRAAAHALPPALRSPCPALPSATCRARARAPAQLLPGACLAPHTAHAAPPYFSCPAGLTLTRRMARRRRCARLSPPPHPPHLKTPPPACAPSRPEAAVAWAGPHLSHERQRGPACGRARRGGWDRVAPSSPVATACLVRQQRLRPFLPDAPSALLFRNFSSTRPHLGGLRQINSVGFHRRTSRCPPFEHALILPRIVPPRQQRPNTPCYLATPLMHATPSVSDFSNEICCYPTPHDL